MVLLAHGVRGAHSAGALLHLQAGNGSFGLPMAAMEVILIGGERLLLHLIYQVVWHVSPTLSGFVKGVCVGKFDYVLCVCVCVWGGSEVLHNAHAGQGRTPWSCVQWTPATSWFPVPGVGFVTLRQG